MVQSVHTTLSELRRLRQRIDQRMPEADDWPVIAALVSNRIAQAERRQAKMAAKAARASDAAASEGEASGPIIDADYTVADVDEHSGSEACPKKAVEDDVAPRADAKPESSNCQ